jgi:RecB family exonuclease
MSPSPRRPAAPRKPSFSPTRFATYLRCPLSHRFAYLEGLRGRFSRPRPQTSLGASLHRVLDAYQREGGAEAMSEQDLLSRLESTWASAGYTSREQEQESLRQAREMVVSFRAPDEGRRATTLLTEKMLKVDRGPYLLTGRLDRVGELPGGELEILDYKSGRSTLTEEDVLGDLGLKVYETLVRAHYPGREVRVSIHALRASLKVTVRRSEEESAQVARWLDDLAAEILADETHEPRVLEACADCDFLRICPAARRRPEG